MDLNSTKASPVITDSSPIEISRLGSYSSMLPCSQSGSSFSTSMLTRKKPEKLNTTVKPSSPPCKKNTKDLSMEISSDDSDVPYVKWMRKYPSALKSFQHIVNQERNRNIVVALDYDGTLSPIVDDPDRAFMSDEMRSAVKNVAKYFPTAIISGRSRDQVSELVGLAELYYAGSHGMDIKFPDKEIVSADNSQCVKSTDQQEEMNVFQPACEFEPMIKEVFRVLVERTSDIPGTKVENHKFCASVHYRNVDEKSCPVVSQRVYDTLEEYPLLRLTHGLKVLEIRPMIDWDKGKALEFLLESLGLSNNTGDVLSIYIGDDTTDEDAFKVLREGNRGYGILVSTVPKESNAFFSLKNPSEVKVFLESIVRMKEEKEL